MFELFTHDLFVTKIVLACYVKTGSGEPIHNDRPSHGFAINCSGEKIYRFSDGQEICVKSNETIYLPKGSYYTVESVLLGDCYAINFELSDEFDTQPFKVPVKDADKILKSFKSAEKYFRLHENGYREKCCKELYSIICSIIDETEENGYSSKHQRMMTDIAVEYISKNYTDKTISVAELADLCGISEVYLRKLFNMRYGVSPIAYINSLKLTYAMALLSSGEYNVSDTCYLCGFNDLSYFSRAFKKYHGISPQDARFNK